ncbi:MAG: sensor histidine kinase [Sinimarinibacterium flocculans]|uniref:sensor histidine kinase n=1 Tax=Sinimarinibacterium flocculans TaxID=985250 RepID=UPI003C56FEA2
MTPAGVLPGADASWQVVDLPDSQAVQRHEGSYFGERHGFDAPFHWYRLELSATLADDADLGLLLPRYADRVRVYLNGERIARSFHEDDRVEHGWNRPFFARLPADALSGERTILMLALDSPYLGRVQLSRPRVGPVDRIEALYARHHALRIFSAQLATGILATIAVLAFGIWLARPRETLHLLMGLASASFAVRQAHFFVVVPWVSPEWFWWLAVSSMAWAMCLVLLLALHYYRQPGTPPGGRPDGQMGGQVGGQLGGRLEAALIAAAVFVTLLTLPGVGVDAYRHAGLIYTALAPIAVIGGVVLLKRALRAPGLPQVLLAGGFLINLLLNLHDLAIQQRWTSIERPFLGPIGAVLMCGSFIVALMARYVQSLADVAALNRDLEARVADRQRELERTHARLRAATAEQAKAEERQRLMREIHDGIGAQLSTALAASERGGHADAAALRTLRAAIADLKLTVDSLEPVDGDLPSLLGNLRYRLTPQLRQAGIAVKWEVSPLPPLAWLQAPQALHILRLLQEAFSNLIQHADADTVRVASGTSNDPEGVWVEISDDGCGIDAQVEAKGRGLANMHERARLLGGHLDVGPAQPRGTRVRLWLPLRAAMRD